MNDDDVQEWLDALAGRDAAATPTGREARALRTALQATAMSAAAVTPFSPRDIHREQLLLERAAREGVIARAPRRSPRWVLPLAASIFVAFAVGVFVRLQLPPEIVRGDEAGVIRLTSSEPAALKQEILTALRSVGVEATGYEALGVHGIDADLPQPPSDELRRVLRQFAIREPADGVLRVEIRKPE